MQYGSAGPFSEAIRTSLNFASRAKCMKSMDLRFAATTRSLARISESVTDSEDFYEKEIDKLTAENFLDAKREDKITSNIIYPSS